MMTAAVRFGLVTFAEAEAGGHRQALREVLDAALLADACGIDHFGLGEHHRADYALSCPEVVAAAILARTGRIAVGSAVTVLSADDPIRVHERFATLHEMFPGRTEIIVGRGAFREPFALFGGDPAASEAQLEAKLGRLMQLVRQAPGAPRVFPVAEGLPVWVAVSATPASVLLAANHRCPVMLAILGGEPARYRAFADLHRAALTRLGVAALSVGVHSLGHVGASDEAAREDAWPAYRAMRDRMGAERGWPPIERRQYDAECSRGALFIGGAETVAQRIAATLRQVGAARFDLKYSIAAMPHDKLRDGIARYGREVVPRVRELLQAPATAAA